MDYKKSRMEQEVGAMAVVDEARRLPELRRAGISDPLIRMATGDCVHEIFRYIALGPPFYVYHGARVPAGPTFIPLWDRSDTVVGIQRTKDGLGFIEFDIETPDDVRYLAVTEQGFWATRFDLAYENDASLDDLREAADRVGFRFFELYLTSREAAEDELNGLTAHQSWLSALAASIDHKAGA